MVGLRPIQPVVHDTSHRAVCSVVKCCVSPILPSRSTFRRSCSRSAGTKTTSTAAKIPSWTCEGAGTRYVASLGDAGGHKAPQCRVHWDHRNTTLLPPISPPSVTLKSSRNLSSTCREVSVTLFRLVITQGRKLSVTLSKNTQKAP